MTDHKKLIAEARQLIGLARGMEKKAEEIPALQYKLMISALCAALERTMHNGVFDVVARIGERKQINREDLRLLRKRAIDTHLIVPETGLEAPNA